jgi:hypothetical protein
MEIPKDKIVELLRDRGQDDLAQRADSELPDQVDPHEHSDELQRFGIDEQQLASKLPDGFGEKLGL